MWPGQGGQGGARLVGAVRWRKGIGGEGSGGDVGAWGVGEPDWSKV